MRRFLLGFVFVFWVPGVVLANDIGMDEEQKKQMVALCEKKKEELKKNNVGPEYQKQFAAICNATAITEGDPQNMAILGAILVSVPDNQPLNNPGGK